MEDIKKRLEFGNIAVQSQAIWRLHNEITKKTTKLGRMDSSSPEFVEMKLLWEKCGTEVVMVAKSACQVLVRLVTDGDADFLFIINGLLNQVPSARSLLGIVNGIGELLVLQIALAENQGQQYSCPYRLRSPPHPFITVLMNRPEAWPLLQHQVYCLCCHGNQSVRLSAMELLAPFMKFVLLEPQQSVQYQPMKTSLERTLIQVIGQAKDQESAKSILCFLTKILPYYQICNPQDLAQTIQFVTEIILQSIGLDKGQTELQALTEFGLSLYHQGVKKGQGVTSLMAALRKVASVMPETMATDQILVTIANTLLSCSMDQVLPLLKLCKQVLETNSSDISPVGARMLLLPMLQILATPKSELIGRQLNVLHSLAGEIILNIENERAVANEMTPAEDVSRVRMTTDSNQDQNFVIWVKAFSLAPGQAVSWLESVMSSLKSTNHVPLSLTNVVSALLTMSRCNREASLALETLILIANKDSTQAPWFLPLMLYQLGRETTPSVRFEIMMTIPRLATHKVCVGPILRTIQSFSSFPTVRGIYIQMLTELWKIQDRCFPQLLMEIQKISSSSLEVLLSTAKSIRDVCKLRPEQHGSDMLAPLSDILRQCTREEEGVVAALALEGLYYLCEAEVINILSAWSVLADSLIRDSRPAVVEKICELFSLVPSLIDRTEEYEKFSQDAVRNLWLYTTSDDTRVCGAAFQALAMYNTDQFKVSFLPQHVTEDLRQQAEQRSLEEERDITVDEVFPSVPSLCYTRLLRTLPTEVLPDYEAFLAAMVAKEVTNLPRGIYHSSQWRQTAAANQNKAIGSIPAFVTGHYNKTKQPGLRPGLAVSTLFCYDPPLDVGRDGRPRKHYVITHSKNFQQMFKTMLNEVPIQPSEWHRSMVLPQAWTSFVDRVYTAMIEGRRAEIDLQLKRDHVSEEEANQKKQVAWLWVRDTLVDIIKINSRGNPTMQSNSIYALAGLAVTVNRYRNGLDTEVIKATEESSEFLSPSHWLTVVIDTIMSLMDVAFTPKGKLLGLCQQQSVENRLPASLLAQASASLALSQVVPALITLDVDRIYVIINFLLTWLPGQPSIPESPILQFHGGLGLGMFLSRLLEEHFADISGTKGMLQIWKSLDKLEECCLKESLDNRSGAILGLGMAVCAMSEEGKTESRAHVVSIYDKMLALYDDLDPLDNIFQSVSVCVACIAGSSFSSNILSVTRVDTAVDKLVTTHTTNPQVTGVCLALGMLSYSLRRAGHPGVGDVRTRLCGTWIKALSTEDTAPMEKVAILNGLMALIGSERTLIPVQSSAVSSDLNIDEVIKVVSHIITSGNDLGIQNNAAWMLGHLYLSASAVADTRASVPATYGYLPEKSFLRAVVDFVSEAGKAGSESVPKEQVELALTSLLEEVEQALPPINWAGLLTPMMRMGFGDKVRCLSLKLAVKQSGTAPTAALFLTTWMTLPLWNTLDESCQVALYDALPVLIRSIAPTAIASLLDIGSSETYISRDGTTNPVLLNILTGLTNALKVNDPPEAVTAVLYKSVGTYYTRLQGTSTQISVMCVLADCLGNLPDEMFDELTGEDFLYNERHLTGCLVRCYLVAQGRQPIAILNSCIDATLNNKQCNHSQISTYLQHCFYHMSQTRSEFTGVMQRLQWLVELLGHVRNIATGATTLSDDIKNKQKVMDLAVDIIAAVFCLWMSASSACVLGITSNILTCPNLSSSQHITSPWKPSVLPKQILPAYITGIQSEPWDQILPKVVDCLTTLNSQPDDIISDVTRKTLQDSLQILRHSTTFKKPTVWSQTYDVVH